MHPLASQICSHLSHELLYLPSGGGSVYSCPSTSTYIIGMVEHMGKLWF